MIRVGTAGWAIPAHVRDAFPTEGSALERYAARFTAVEINSSFHRSHRSSTYGRWAASVPPAFRFALKLPKAITHDRRLQACEGLLRTFADEIGELGAHRGPILVQLPPSLAFDPEIADNFFTSLHEACGTIAVCEPRHASWFGEDVDRFLAERKVARAAADPAIIPQAARTGGFGALAYFRLHGSPRTYRSSYDQAQLKHVARSAASASRSGTECWIIFDNTASGAAAANALELLALLGLGHGRQV